MILLENIFSLKIGVQLSLYRIYFYICNKLISEGKMQRYFIISLLLILAISCNNQDNNIKLTPDEEEYYIKAGDLLVKESFDSLMSNVKRAIEETGIKGALKYCNLNAYPIIYHLEKTKNVKIRRTSNKFRNPANQPDSLEKSILEYYSKLLSDGKNLKPIIKPINNDIHFFKPIIIMDLCLKCHGSIGNELKLDDYNTITELYPFDNATGYKAGDLRGMWHLIMKYRKQ
jgi:hypothetical protein